MTRNAWDADPRKWGHYDDEPEFDGAGPVTRQEAAETPAAPPSPAVGASAGEAAAYTAARLAGDLAWQSRAYPGVAWAVCACEHAGQTSLYAVSNEGMGFLPPGVRWDKRLRHVFGPSAPDAELGPWLGLANPARIVVEHYLRLRSLRPGLRLTAIASTQPPGNEVSDFLRAVGASSEPPEHEAAPGANLAANRLEAVFPGEFDRIISDIPVRQLWVAAVDLTADAAERSEFQRFDPSLMATLENARAGRAFSTRAVDQARDASLRYAAQAQAARVPDIRLGPVDANSAGPTVEQVIAWSAGSAYTRPFFAARVSAMAHALLAARAQDIPLDEAQLAEILYEHYVVTNDADAGRAALTRHAAAGGDAE